MDKADEPQGTSRRWFLAGGAAVLLGGGAGVLADFLQESSSHPPPPAPRALLAAISAERVLIADLTATTGGTPPVRRIIVRAHADHAAHLAALVQLREAFGPSPGSRSPSPSPSLRGTPRTLAQLRAAEAQASAAAARHAAQLDGGLAALLASISACEASHAELLR